MNLSEQIIDFYNHLACPSFLPEGVEVMNPYTQIGPDTYVDQFYSKYYDDYEPRIMLVGINPGRFGGGVTGIPFTDPVNLQEACAIRNNLEKRHELSSKFIYDMIQSFGGPARFYRSFYVTAASPLGFVKGGKNLNYYDIPELQENWKPFIVQTLKHQAGFCRNNSVCFSLGQGKNYKFLLTLNKEYKIFKDVRALPHPRWVMQYRLKRKKEFIRMYEEALEICLR